MRKESGYMPQAETGKKTIFRKYLFVLLSAAVLVLLSGGCGSKIEETERENGSAEAAETEKRDETEKIKVVLTTGFGKDEVFRIESTSCSVSEIMVYLTNTQNQYESIYGTRIWDKTLRGTTLEQNVKDTVLAELAEIKVMSLLAGKYGVTLNDREKTLAQQAGAEYYASLNEAEIRAMDVDEKSLTAMYEEYAIADKVYRYIIKDINPEISDDEARTITISHILIKTYSLGSDGRRVPYEEAEKRQAREKAEQVLAEIQAGADFDSLVTRYNEDSKSIYSFGKGEMEEGFEKAAFNLGTGEISDIVETQYGYHIIRCISTFNKEETDANKVKIVEQRRKEVFSQEYDAFAESLARNMNPDVWESIAMIHDDTVNTSAFFRIYEKYFDGVFGQK